MRIFTEVEVDILVHLGHYKYMTLAQLVKLGVGGKTYTSTRLKKMREEGLVGVSQYGGVYKSGGGGRVQNINYLSVKGAKILAENLSLDISSVHYPKNIDGMFRNDYFHRISTVNTQVAFDLWAKRLGNAVLFFDTYFHKLGSAKTAKDDNPLRSLTRINFKDGSFIEPDAIFAADRGSGKKFFFCLEVHNGVDVSRLIDGLKRLARAVEQGLITKAYEESYGMMQSPRVLCTLETENMLRLVQKRMCSDMFFTPAWTQQVFLFNVAEKAWEDFGGGWQNFKGAVFNLSEL